MTLATRVPHPIPYQGSKRGLATEILSHMPESVDRLVEPFAGSAAVSLAAAQHGRARSFWINDAHAPLVDLWREIIDRPDELADRYAAMWRRQAGQEREYFDQVRGLFNRTHQPQHFLYLLARCVKAAVRYNSRGEFNNTPDNRRKGARPEAMQQRIRGASELLRGRTVVTCRDYRDVLHDCGPGDLVYMDPPYQGVCGSRDGRYALQVEHGEFRDALAQLVRRRCLFAVSYDGRTGGRRYGAPLPPSLGLRHLEICAGRSTQSTLLGLDSLTYESLYLSPALVKACEAPRRCRTRSRPLVPHP